MDRAMRNSGIRILGRVPWGIHFCQFYQTKKDLLDILVPYFKAGLEDNEFCMWICSEPLDVAEAKKALRKAVPGLAGHIRKGHIEILPHTDWYLKRGKFNPARLLMGWIDKLNDALDRGFDGLRLSGNTFWLEKKDWKAFAEYEEEVNNVISRYPMIALSTYSLDRCGVREVIDVLDTHQRALIRRGGKWTQVASLITKRTQKHLKESEQRFREIFDKSPIGIELYDTEGRLVEVNSSCLDIFGVTDISEVKGFRLFEDPNLPPNLLAKLRKGVAVRYEILFDFDKIRRLRLYQTKRSGVIDLDVQVTPLGRPRRELSGYLVQVMDISERKRAQAALDESQRRLKLLYESDIIGIFWTDRNQIIDANEAFLRLAGYGREDLEAGRILWRPMTPREYWRLDDRALKQLEIRAGARPYEKEFIRKDGTRVPILIGAAVIERSPLRWVCFVLDISKQKDAERALTAAYEEMEHRVEDRTSDLRKAVKQLRTEVSERQRTQKALTESARLLETFFSSTITPLVFLDKEFNFIRVNEAYASACQRPVSDFPGHNHFEFYPNKENEEIFRNVVKTKTPYRTLARPFSFPDHPEWGVTYWDWTLSPVLNDAGDVEFLIFSLDDVTEEARAQQELRRSELLLRNVLDMLPIGVWITDKHGRIITGNPAGHKIWGGARYVGIEQYGEYKGWWADTGERIRAEDWAAARAVTKGETSINEEIEIECFDGTHKFILNSALPMRDADNEISGAIIINQDITRRRAGERKLHEQAALLDLAQDAILVRDSEGRITFWNSGATKTYGYTEEEVKGRVTRILLNSGYPEPLEQIIEHLSKDGHWEGEIFHSRKDGKRIVVESRWAVLPGKDRQMPAAILQINRDITERKIAEQERLRLATAVEQIAEGIAIMDPKGSILSANPAFAKHHGLQQQDIVGRSFREILQVDEEDTEIIKKMRESLESGKVWTGHLTERSPSGRVRELDLAVSPIRDGSGRLVNSIAVERDVTQETLLQEQIRQRQKMEALGTLAGGIAHDFNNILLAIQINTELTLAGEAANSSNAQRLGQVLEAAKRGKDMVKQIITFSRQKEQERQPVEILPIIREALEFLRVSLPKTIEISEKIEAESAMAMADPTQIHQVLINLGSNAAYAMREKGGSLEIGLSEIFLDEETASAHIDLKPGPHLCLTVRDTGHGVAPEVLDRMFEPFFTTKKPGEGAGMGLAVVHGIVKSHSGAITVSSQLGEGTVFTIYLPRIIGPRQVMGEKQEPFPKGTERILFVDDEAIQVRAMNRLLKYLGYRVVGLSDGSKALEVFHRRPGAFDLVIMDQTMPHITGIELAREMLKIKPGLPVILCTGYSENLNEEEALASGVRTMMMKPFSMKEIAETIRRVLRAKD